MYRKHCVPQLDRIKGIHPNGLHLFKCPCIIIVMYLCSLHTIDDCHYF